VKRTIEGLAEMFRRDKEPRRQKLADELISAYHGQPSTELGTLLAKMFKKTIGNTMDFASRLKESEGESLVHAVARWLKTIKSPMTVYVATHGVQLGLPQTKAWENLGVKEVYPDARVVCVEGNHFDIVENDEVIRDLETCWRGNA
jgi:hypothetical protein